MTKRTDLTLVKPTTTAVDRFSENLGTFLESLGLPSTGVLATASERGKVFQNLPALVDLLDDGQRTEAMYVSKFVAACGAGLFDAALNYIWDEVVVRLRARVARFDLGYFFDTAVTDPQERSEYKTAEDLTSLTDAALIRGALKCGMLTDVAYKHLDYIRDMRNWASAAHPNQAQLTGLQLVSWFETCVKDVILNEPAGEVLEVGRLLKNIRTQELTAGDVPAIAASIRRMPVDLVAALLRSLVGHYADPRQDVRISDNVRLIAAAVWASAPESAKGEIGIKHGNFAANGDVDRGRLVHQFLDLVGGLTYLPAGDLANAVAERVARLRDAHDGWNNFSNEPPAARELRKFIGADGLVPSQINDEYVRVVDLCRVGTRPGVSNAASPIYDELINRFTEVQIRVFAQILSYPELATRLSDPGCCTRFHAIIARLLPKIVDQPLRRILEAMAAATAAQLPYLVNNERFAKLVAAL